MYLARICLSAALALVTVACTTSKVALHPELRRGPAYGSKVTRVLVAPPTCGSIEHPCPDEYVALVDAIVRSGLEFQGYSALAPDELLLTTRQRTETRDDETVTRSTTTTKTGWIVVPVAEKTRTDSEERTVKKHIELVGSTFDDLPPAERRALLAEAGASGVATVRLVVGATQGTWSPSQDVEVVVKLTAGDGERMVWASRCIAPSRSFTSARAAIEQAARCAMAPTDQAAR